MTWINELILTDRIYSFIHACVAVIKAYQKNHSENSLIVWIRICRM